MNQIELILLAIGLSMDAFSVSICKGLSTRKIHMHQYVCLGLWFGGFQVLMPVLGYFLGSAFASYINAYAHYIALILLGIIGSQMLKAGLSKEETEEVSDAFGVKTMFLMAVATSIDALAVGVTFAILPDVHLMSAVSIIGITTFAVSVAGLKIGNIFGVKYKSKAEILGGIILICIGIKIFLEGIGII
ncbi:manganese efflux pump MntP family protein [Chakrabartyella piscis]|uniref:manganese efflux pump MntP n=1 Tax=Chakrabartyella piscis TaxID=2918914 RepID=UPI0029586E6A|nr:manganese efflux pump MntP family protein [Chakrabartyella piscis]